jgi:RNA polymerase sigma-70 factor (ECF subfamily)
MTFRRGPTRFGEPVWLQPYPDALLDGLPSSATGPDAAYEAKESIALAFVVAVQHLPPRQRAILLLRDALGFRSPEVADLLDTSEASVNSALQRARATMTALLPAPDRERAPLPRSARERALGQRFAAAYAEDDVDGVVALLTEDAWFTMPPADLEYQGTAAIAAFLAASARFRGHGGTRLVPVRANGQPAFGRYVPDTRAEIFHAHSIVVLTLAGDRICAITNFIGTDLLSHFGLARTLPR